MKKKTRCTVWLKKNEPELEGKIFLDLYMKCDGYPVHECCDVCLSTLDERAGSQFIRIHHTRLGILNQNWSNSEKNALRKEVKK